jgi:catechol 2,3-dioxygenase-like lactoylglutathione lyase family enzyme
MLLDHVALEVPASRLDEAVEWFESNLGLHCVDKSNYGVRFREGLHIESTPGTWMSNPQRLAHICFRTASPSLFLRIRENTKECAQQIVSDNRFFITTPWTKRIEICQGR